VTSFVFEDVNVLSAKQITRNLNWGRSGHVFMDA